MKERDIQANILLQATKAGARLFRNNVGKGWIGQWSKLSDGSILLRNPRRMNFGLCKGSSDLIGWVPVTITEDMVGQTVAVFAGIECKTKTGRVSAEQQNFLDAIHRAGGISIVGRDPDAVFDELAKYRK